MTAALEGDEWSAPRPGRTLPPGKIRYPFYRRLGGPQGRSGRVENLVSTGIRSRTENDVVTMVNNFKAMRNVNTVRALAVRPQKLEGTANVRGNRLSSHF